MRARSHARHVLQQVQRESLTREDGAGTALHLGDDGGLVEGRPVLQLRRELDIHARVLGVDDARGRAFRPHDGIRRDVAAADILFKP